MLRNLNLCACMKNNDSMNKDIYGFKSLKLKESNEKMKENVIVDEDNNGF